MDKLESSYAKYIRFKVACSQCNILFDKADDDPFVCLRCGEK